MIGFSKEPARLLAEQERIEHDIVQVAVAQHAAFTRSAEVTQIVAVQINAARKATMNATAALEKLNSKCQTLSGHGQQWRGDKQKASTALSQHPKLSEILEAPSTLELCLRNEMYHEAMLVLEHVASMAQQSEGSVLMQTVRDQCVDSLQRLLHHIISTKLCGPLTVAQALRTVKFLLRMGIPVKQVRLLFVEQRGVYINQLLQEAASVSTSSYTYLSKLLSIFKVHVADVITQFDACFNSPVGGAGVEDSGSAFGSAATANAPTSGNSSVVMGDDLHGLCHQWVVKIVSSFDVHVPRIISSTELRSLAEQLMQTSVSLSKESLDVSSLLLPTISHRVTSIFQQHLKDTLIAFRSSVDSFSWRSDANSLKRFSSGTDLASSMKSKGSRDSIGAGASAEDLPNSDPAAASGGDREGEGGGIEERSPSMRLMAFPPLALALNGVLNGYNEIRKCIPSAAVTHCLLTLEKFLSEVCQAVLAADPSPNTAASSSSSPNAPRSNNKAFTLFVSALLEDLLPYLSWATKSVFGGRVSSNFQNVIDQVHAQLKPYAPVPVIAAAVPAPHSRPSTPGAERPPTGTPTGAAPAEEELPPSSSGSGPPGGVPTSTGSAEGTWSETSTPRGRGNRKNKAD